MVKTKINGVSIDMPYDPYPPQLVAMSKLIQCFQTGTSALIESPTGTGKSLSIICSALAFNSYTKRSEDGAIKPYKIYICSRTHKQLDQLVDQLRKTTYRPRITILGSKAQYCINPKLKDIQDKNTACSDLIKIGGCVYFTGKDRLIKKSADKVFDIEELKNDGKKCAGCPYFAARGMIEDADIIFAPYNYLIDPNIREASDIKLENAIVIIDEAHNLEDVCRNSGSLEITSKLLDMTMNELIGAIKKSALLGGVKTELLNLMDFFRKLRENSEREDFDSVAGGHSMRIRKGKEILAELEMMKITKDSFLIYKNALKAISGDEDGKQLLSLNTFRNLEEVERVVGGILFSSSSPYAFCFQKTKSDSGNNYMGNFKGNDDMRAKGSGLPDNSTFSYNFWLLDPSVMFLPVVRQARSVSLLSGTLSPFSSFSGELKHTFQHKVSAPHIIKDEQVFVASIRQGHLKKDLCGIYSVVETPAYLEQICSIITDISVAVQADGGTLVFVPSYAFLNKLQGRIKDALVEPKNASQEEFEKTLKKYKTRIASRLPSILLCVYRGKAAEGIDFRDEYARAVVAIGIPYPSVKDPQISLKKEYNDNNSEFNGRLWYEAQAFRALNQALGRAIRHSKDWGAVFLLESRFFEKKNQNQLPGWVCDNFKKFDNYSGCVDQFKKFISNCKSLNKENKATESTIK